MFHAAITEACNSITISYDNALHAGLHNLCIVTLDQITVYLLLWVNLDKIMHARWDFDASEVHKFEGLVHLTSIKIEAQVHYFVYILKHKVNTQLLI